MRNPNEIWSYSGKTEREKSHAGCWFWSSGSARVWELRGKFSLEMFWLFGPEGWRVEMCWCCRIDVRGDSNESGQNKNLRVRQKHHSSGGFQYKRLNVFLTTEYLMFACRPFLFLHSFVQSCPNVFSAPRLHSRTWTGSPMESCKWAAVTGRVVFQTSSQLWSWDNHDFCHLQFCFLQLFHNKSQFVFHQLNTFNEKQQLECLVVFWCL